MIPLRLQLRNFMCYGETASPLVLDGIHIACLSGENGHGKSALLDAMTWALWGKARAKTDDELIHIGKTEMEVEFEFAVGSVRHRVIRKRTVKGKRGLPTLEFQIQSASGYHPVTGDSVQDTQRKISAALRMEYETFINSALLLQGRADEFTVKPPAERKKVLGDVLGLAVYNDLEERARQLSRAAEQTRRELSAALAEIARELDRRPEYEALRDQVAAELAAVERQLVAQERALQRAREAKQELDAKSARVAELRQRQERERRALADLEAQLVADRADLSANEAVLADRELIAAGYRQLLDLRTRNDALARQATGLLALQSRKAALEQAIARGRHALEAEAQVCMAGLASAQRKTEQRPAIERDLTNVQRQLAVLDGLETQRDALRETAQSCRSQIALLKATNERLREDMNLLKQKIDVLAGEGATCPVCESELGPAGRTQLATKLKAEGRQLSEDYRTNASRGKDLEAQVAQTQRELAQVDQRLADRERLRRQAGVLERSLSEADEASREAAAAAQLVDQLRTRLTAGEFAPAEQRDLAGLLREIEALGYDPEQHERVRREIGQRAAFEQRWAAVQTAEKAVALLREKVRQNDDGAARQRNTLQDITALLEVLSREVAQGSHVLAELVEAQERLDQLGKSSAELRVQLGRAEQLVHHCQFLDQQCREKTAVLQRATDEKAVYDELSLAFGKKGIQAMIIDSAIPEIEAEANLLLARLTDNRMHVKLETQRSAKSGDGVIETLDIKIADELGYRQYELYSGGESFRVNFAIRIALSKLLARRAGAKLQTLIIDEGFGTQDAGGRERLVEAISGVSEDFERILVITHIQELKDAFPVRIDVVKGVDGSNIIMTE